MAIAIDAVRIARRLRDAGATPEQAEAFAQVVKEEIADQAASREDLEQLATKADLREGLNTLRAELRAEMRTGFAESRADFRVLKWMCGVTSAAVVALVVTLIAG